LIFVFVKKCEIGPPIFYLDLVMIFLKMIQFDLCR